MSIVFTKPIESSKLRMAYNNDVIKFYSNDSTNPATYADIEIGTDVAIRLYPSPDGTFFFNFKPYATSLINTRNFEDTLEVDIDGSDFDTFFYAFSNGTLLTRNIKITVPGSNTGTSLTWLAGAEQLGDHRAFSKNNRYFLSPLQKLQTKQCFVKYWQGYPFDVTTYKQALDAPIGGYRLLNETNLLSADHSFFSSITRIVFSDGRTDETLENFLPLVDGFNTIRWYAVEQGPGVDDPVMIVEKVPYKCGIYMKWLNRYGGYSYWLFEDTYAIDRATKQIGELDRDYANLEDTFTRAIQIGKESQDKIRVIAELLTEDDRTVLEGIIDSPKIYLFTGQPFARNSYRDWIEVSLKTSNVRIKNPKQALTNFSLEFELPQRYTQTL